MTGIAAALLADDADRDASSPWLITPRAEPPSAPSMRTSIPTRRRVFAPSRTGPVVGLGRTRSGRQAPPIEGTSS
jgi:hypothetical protein